MFLLLSALGGGLGRPRRWGIPSPEGERRMSNSKLKVLHFDLESSRIFEHCGNAVGTSALAVEVGAHSVQVTESYLHVGNYFIECSG